MIDDLVQNLHGLGRADALIGRMWLNVLVRRLGLFVFASLIAACGLGMANVAAFYTFEEPTGAVWAATIVALCDFALAMIVALVSYNLQPDPEIDRAFEARKAAIESIQDDAGDVKTSIDKLGQDLRDVKDSIAAFVHDPIDSAVQQLLIPAATSIINGLRKKNDQASETPRE